jgi:hypothetical protein
MKTLNIPKLLHELHGKQASVLSLVLVYSTALLFGCVVSFQIIPLALPAWKSILLFVIVADIAGGAIANFTTSTRQYYRENKRLQLPFLLMHLLHPVLLFWVVPQFTTVSILMGALTFVSVIIIRLLAHNQELKVISVFLFVVNCTIILLIPCTFDYLKIIPILFFLKLIMGFAVGVFIDKKRI